MPVRASFPVIWGTRDQALFQGYIDDKGQYTIEGDSTGEIFAFFEAKGYYGTRFQERVKEYPDIDRLEKDIPIVVKRIRNPIPMYARLVHNKSTAPIAESGPGFRYNLGATSQFDMVKGDFLPPYGNGERGDISFLWKMDVLKLGKDGLADDYDTFCNVRFTNSLDGICMGKADGAVAGGQLGSKFMSRYEAPLDGYTNRYLYFVRVRYDKRESNSPGPTVYYFRIRTEVDSKGQVTNALYGKVYGTIEGSFRYYLNPVPNDRNVEFDPKKNLFKNLRSSEQVVEP